MMSPMNLQREPFILNHNQYSVSKMINGKTHQDTCEEIGGEKSRPVYTTVAMASLSSIKGDELIAVASSIPQLIGTLQRSHVDIIAVSCDADDGQVSE